MKEIVRLKDGRSVKKNNPVILVALYFLVFLNIIMITTVVVIIFDSRAEIKKLKKAIDFYQIENIRLKDR